MGVLYCSLPLARLCLHAGELKRHDGFRRKLHAERRPLAVCDHHDVVVLRIALASSIARLRCPAHHACARSDAGAAQRAQIEAQPARDLRGVGRDHDERAAAARRERRDRLLVAADRVVIVKDVRERVKL